MDPSRDASAAQPLNLYRRTAGHSSCSLARFQFLEQPRDDVVPSQSVVVAVPNHAAAVQAATYLSASSLK
ncbi:hypothetical protein M0R45_008956 [Rubus argutus]|uniref:Uncharacterized protein n=1 Tax=Rubus argutus TaxID=59490 RepID=A0AAW1Y4L2_RUBAR